MTRIRTLPAAQAVPSSPGNSLAREIMTGTPDACVAGYTYDNNKSTRIGQLSVANGTGIHATYFYNTSADSTMDVGVLQSNGDYTASGTVGVSNSIGAGGSDPHAGYTLTFINDHMNDEHVTYCLSAWIQPYSSNGDVYDGGGTPGAMPWSTCSAAPYIATVSPNGGTWEGENSTSVNLSWDVSAFGLFEGRGETEYEKTNKIEWTDTETTKTYICGKGGGGEGLDGSALFWNANH
jgi:hypothetical protein